MLNAAFLRISGNRRDQKIVGGNVMEKTDRSGKSRWSKLSAKKRRGYIYLAMSIPFVVFVLAFSYVPLFGWGYAFINYKTGFSMMQSEFVGLKYFRKLFTDKDMGRILRNTLVMSGLGLLTSPLPVIFAILLNEIHHSRIKNFVQTATTLPNFISWIIIYGIAYGFFSGSGMVNQLLEKTGLPTSQFGLIGDVSHTWSFMLALGIWKSLGWNSIIYLATITGIDQELYGAAQVDGANKVQLIWYITVPGVLPTYFVLLMLDISNILSNGFEKYYMFWNSLVSDKIEVLDYYIYKLGFSSNQYSYAVAVGMVKSLIAIVLLFGANWMSKKIRGDSIF